MTQIVKYLCLTLFASLIVKAAPASAHASEQGLVLLLPTAAYATAGTLTVIASMLLVIWMPKGAVFKLFKGVEVGSYRTKLNFAPDSMASMLSTLVLLAIVAIGFRGPTDPQNNLLPLVIWTVWWVGIFVVQGTIFDIWKWLNPWAGIAKFSEIGTTPIVQMPAGLAAWPAVALLIGFQAFLLADIAPSDPRRLASFVFGYWLFTLICIALFGRDDWLKRGECFSVMFRMLSLLRPIQWSGGIRIGLPGWRALETRLDVSLASFCLVVLAAGSFDGLHETFWWLAQIGINPLEFPGRSAVIWTSTYGLVAAILVLFLIFSFSLWIGLKAVQMRDGLDTVTFADAFCMFSVTLLPIALGYHFGHYIVSFMVQIKYTLSTASDPLAVGWNLFGLGAVKVTTGFLAVPSTVKTIWLTQATVVVVSHVVSVLMGHHVASKMLNNNKDIVIIQLGLAMLMITYTIFGLWLLASPRGA